MWCRSYIRAISGISLIAPFAIRAESPNDLLTAHLAFVAENNKEAIATSRRIIRDPLASPFHRLNALELLEQMVPTKGHSAFTRLGPSQCNEPINGAPDWRVCEIREGYSVEFKWDGEQQIVQLRPQDAPPIPLRIPSHLMRPGLSFGPSLQWRFIPQGDGQNDKLIAIIVRVLRSEPSTIPSQYLLVQALHHKKMCPMAVIAAAVFPEANEVAERLADLFADDFRCDSDIPIVL